VARPAPARPPSTHTHGHPLHRPTSGRRPTLRRPPALPPGELNDKGCARVSKTASANATPPTSDLCPFILFLPSPPSALSSCFSPFSWQDLEFVQALACPHYVLHLSQAGYLADPAFLGYLRHLEYWRAPGYAAFLQYPAGLAILDLLRSASARAALSRPDVADWVHAQQFFQWSKYWANRAADA
jgi:hypothetical protein